MHTLLGLFDRTESPAAEVPARVVVARLLATHAAAGRTKLGTKASLSTAKPRDQAKRHERVGVLPFTPKEAGYLRVSLRDRASGGGEDEVGGIGVKGKVGVAFGKDLVEFAEGRLGW